MNKAETKTFLELLAEIPDYRKGNAIKYDLSEILLIGIMAILCGADTYTGMQLWGETHIAELRKIIELNEGIPSHDVFGDVFSRIDINAVNNCFNAWLYGIKEKLSGDNESSSVVAIDGKTVRRSNTSTKRASHIVTAFSSDLQLVLGQICTDEKSNEITAIPKLLELLAVEDSIITIDAMGTQVAIAEKIVDKKADYILALKENHPDMLNDIKYYAEAEMLSQPKSRLSEKGLYYKSTEKNHGRVETRECFIIDDISWLYGKERWKKLSGAALIRTKRVVNDLESTCDHYYIYSKPNMTAKEFMNAKRKHWAIENNLHWMLDVCFKEDYAHIRIGNAAVVLNMFRKLAFQLLKSDTSVKGSMQAKRQRCAWDFNYALTVIRSA